SPGPPLPTSAPTPIPVPEPLSTDTSDPPFTTYPALTEVIQITRQLQPTPTSPEKVNVFPTLTLTASSTQDTEEPITEVAPTPSQKPHDEPVFISPKRFPLTANHSTDHRLVYTPSWEVMNKANSSAPPLTPILDLGKDTRDQPLQFLTGSWISLELIHRPGMYIGLTNVSSTPESAVSSVDGIIHEFGESFRSTTAPVPSLLSIPQPDPKKYPGVAIQLDSPRALPSISDSKKEDVIETYLRASSHHFLRWANATALTTALASSPASIPLQGLTFTADPAEATLFRFTHSKSSSSPGLIHLHLQDHTIPVRVRALPQLHGQGIMEELAGTQSFQVATPLRHRHVLIELKLENPSSLPQTMSYQLDLTRSVVTSVYWFNILQLSLSIKAGLSALLFSPQTNMNFQLFLNHDKQDDLIIQANRMVKADILVRPQTSLRARIISVESSYTVRVDAIVSRTLLDPRTGEPYAGLDGRMGKDGPRPPSYYSIQGQMSVSVDGSAELHVGQETPFLGKS
ncbi:hypothetical protein BJ684DRAFT_18105, partial [Piptocephalis cylindrospora]